MSHWRSVAYVESPLQLLSVLEAHAYGAVGANTEVLVRDPHGTIAPTLSALRTLGLPVGVKVHVSKDSQVGLGRSPVKADFQHVLGDPFSGQQQSGLLRRSRVGEIVMVDDGLNTYAAIEALAANKPLVRPGATSSSARKALGLATTHILRKAAFAGRLTIFTAMPPTDRMLSEVAVLDARLITHEFNWLTGKPMGNQIVEPRVIVGSGFAADGLINGADYVNWVAEVSDLVETRYLPHRRLPTALEQQIAQLPHVVIDQQHTAVELELRSLRNGQEVHLLPTTALVTLAPMLSRNNVTVVPYPVRPAWWTESTTALQRDYLSRPLELFESLSS